MHADDPLIDTLLTGLPPRYEHTDSLLARAAAEGPMRALAVSAWRAMIADRSRAAFALSHHLRRKGARLRSWERRLVAAGLYAMLRSHRWLAAMLDTRVRDARDLWLGWLVMQGLDPALTRTETRCDIGALHPDHLVDRARAALRALPSPIERIAVATSLPDALAERLVDDLGGPLAAAAFGVASNQRGPLTLRVNRLRTSREAVLDALAALDIEATASPLAPDAITLAGRVDVRELELYADGHIEVQDAGSQRVLELVDAAPDSRVVDLCAGAGGKTLALAAAMGGTGELFVYDVRKPRLQALVGRAQRAGVADMLRVDAVPPPGTADAVLVDAPCTGSGTLRREPALRWRLDEARIAEMQTAQREVLQAGAELVRPGGQLVYVTCSVFRPENEGIVEAFLDRQPDFDLERAPVTLRPDRHDCDGFYAVSLRRTGEKHSSR